ncbi:RNA recognition motif-containing protein [Cryptosporidium felis]|nr:RNA recognition motif-containing protein [Cryptosporidium felis]
MSYLIHSIGPEYSYFDRKSCTKDEWLNKISRSSTVYVGNLSFFTTEEVVNETFSQCGPVKAIYLGLNNQTMQPCGFCFVQYFRHVDALAAVTFLNRSFCDGREIRVDWDSGEDISGSRRYGRGNTGFQWRDELRNKTDPDRQLESTNSYLNQQKNYKFSHGNNYGYQKRQYSGRGRHRRGTYSGQYYNRSHNKHKYQQFESYKFANSTYKNNYPDY